MGEARISRPEARLWQAVLLSEIAAAKGQPLYTGHGQDVERDVRNARRWLCKDGDLWYVAALAGLDGDLVREWALRQQAMGWPPAKRRTNTHVR